MANSMDGPCVVWPIDRDHGCWNIPAGTSEATISHWQEVASDYLWQMTGRRLGPSCPVTVRPCKRKCFENYRFLFQGQNYLSTGNFIPFMRDGQMYNASLCGCPSNGCHCGPELCEIELAGPIFDIQSVTIDGVTLDPFSYSVYDGRYVVRMNNLVPVGGDPVCWPSCQDLTLDSTRANTFEIKYRTGLRLTPLATAAVTELTAHFIRGCNGGCGCSTSTRNNLQRLSRQGVDLEFADPQQLFTDGRTGIQSVDFFIRSANPFGLASPMRVLSPDAPKRGRNWGEYI